MLNVVGQTPFGVIVQKADGSTVMLPHSLAQGVVSLPSPLAIAPPAPPPTPSPAALPAAPPAAPIAPQMAKPPGAGADAGMPNPYAFLGAPGAPGSNSAIMNALRGAGTGASFGSIIPGIGTGIGAAIGGGLGLLGSLF